jgi:chromosome segregation ATPase
MTWFQARHKHSKILDRSREIQEQSHYNPSDYPGSADLLVDQEQQIREEIENANQRIAFTDETIAAALQPLLQQVSEACAKSCNPSKASEEQAVLEAKLAAVSITLKKEAQDSIEQESAGLQQKLQELVESHMVKLKDAIDLETEQKQEKKLNNKLHSLRKTLTQEAEDRATNLRKTLAHDFEKRVAEMEETIIQRHKKKIDQLEKSLAEANLKNAKLHDSLKSLEARFDQAASEQGRLLKSLVDETQLSQKLQQLSVSKDEKLSKLEARLESLPNHASKLEQLEEDMREHSKFIEKKAEQQDEASTRLEALESTSSKAFEEVKKIKEHVQSLGSSHKSATALTDRQILEVIRPELDKSDEKLKNGIQRIQDGLTPFLSKERASREALESQLEDISGQLSELQSESSTTKTKLSGFAEDSNKNRHLVIEGMKSLENEVNGRLDLVTSELKSITRVPKPDFELSRDAYEGICLQLQALDNWQNHFNTRGLFKEIVAYIQNALPESARMKIDRLEARLTAFENSFSQKRRKLPGSNAAMVNGHQQDSA